MFAAVDLPENRGHLDEPAFLVFAQGRRRRASGVVGRRGCSSTRRSFARKTRRFRRTSRPNRRCQQKRHWLQVRGREVTGPHRNGSLQSCPLNFDAFGLALESSMIRQVPHRDEGCSNQSGDHFAVECWGCSREECRQNGAHSLCRALSHEVHVQEHDRVRLGRAIELKTRSCSTEVSLKPTEDRSDVRLTVKEVAMSKLHEPHCRGSTP